jgi:hypothetical protein
MKDENIDLYYLILKEFDEELIYVNLGCFFRKKQEIISFIED